MLTSSGFKIKRGDLQSQMLKELNVRPIVGDGFQGAPYFKVYRENLTRIRLPRFYGQSHYPSFTNDVSIDAYTRISIPFQGVLKVENAQVDASNTVINTLRTKGGGVLSLPTGYGKTTVALHVVSVIGVKTLIIVHKEFLMNQWIERIKQFIPSAKIGIIRQNTVEVIGKDIVICMLQSLSMKSYDKHVFNGFGLTVIDETHHICSRTFSSALFNVTTKYILGLSATPERKDGLTKVLNWFVGDICFKIERDVSNLDIKCEQLNFYCDEFVTTDIPLSVTGRISVPGIINIIANISVRNALIVDRLKLFLDDGRKTIVLSDRRRHCEELLERLNNEGIFDCGLYMGGMSEIALKNSESKNILLATYSLAQEGLDIPSLDTLILATPKTDVVQACGRILRTGNVRKHQPYILDIVDSFSILINQGKKRSAFYKKSGFKIIKDVVEKEIVHVDESFKTFSFI